MGANFIHPGGGKGKHVPPALFIVPPWLELGAGLCALWSLSFRATLPGCGGDRVFEQQGQHEHARQPVIVIMSSNFPTLRRVLFAGPGMLGNKFVGLLGAYAVYNESLAAGQLAAVCANPPRRGSP